MKKVKRLIKRKVGRPRVYVSKRKNKSTGKKIKL